ncbi:MAG: M15 family metallopeptidase [Methylocystis sp.]|uniref:M15 family metallopeptidase n=1 Tax=Methylocystis sp. TaxID=1911079 RepID=UPI003DA3801F
MSFLRVAAVAAISVMAPVLAWGQTVSPQALVLAYPDQLQGQDGQTLSWKDGFRQPLSDGVEKTFQEKLGNASLLDQLSLPYPKGPQTRPPGREEDPGRFRNTAFFDRMYGDCQKGETQKRLTTIQWVGGERLQATEVNGVARHLREIATELSRLPEPLKKFVSPSAGAFSCRAVKDTGKPSMHAYGAAIDINVKQADYWLWSGGAYRNRIPYEIVAVFERHGFIWGGKWGHFDTMHFEYRPEFFVAVEGAEKRP